MGRKGDLGINFKTWELLVGFSVVKSPEEFRGIKFQCLLETVPLSGIAATIITAAPCPENGIVAKIRHPAKLSNRDRFAGGSAHVFKEALYFWMQVLGASFSAAPRPDRSHVDGFGY